MIKLIFATLCIYVTGCAGSALEDTNEGDLNQEENDDSVSDIFHSSFWTSKEIKVMTKNIFSYGALLVNASYGNLMVIDRNILRILLGSATSWVIIYDQGLKIWKFEHKFYTRYYIFLCRDVSLVRGSQTGHWSDPLWPCRDPNPDQAPLLRLLCFRQ